MQAGRVILSNDVYEGQAGDYLDVLLKEEQAEHAASSRSRPRTLQTGKAPATSARAAAAIAAEARFRARAPEATTQVSAISSVRIGDFVSRLNVMFLGHCDPKIYIYYKIKIKKFRGDLTGVLAKTKTQVRISVYDSTDVSVRSPKVLFITTHELNECCNEHFWSIKTVLIVQRRFIMAQVRLTGLNSIRSTKTVRFTEGL